MHSLKMGYDTALSMAWSQLENIAQGKDLSVRFLSDEYTVDLDNRRILSLSCNAPAKTHVSILILHYLKQQLGGLPRPEGEWVSFRQLEGGQGYYPAFKKRVIDRIVKKYGLNPQAIFGLTECFKAKSIDIADYGIVLEVFEGVSLLITLWGQDEEFSPEANVLFDKSIKDIFCTEDIVVLAEFVAHNV